MLADGRKPSPAEGSAVIRSPPRMMPSGWVSMIPPHPSIQSQEKKKEMMPRKQKYVKMQMNDHGNKKGGQEKQKKEKKKFKAYGHK